MQFELPDHAKFRLMERSVDVDHAKSAIKSPDKKKINDDGTVVVTKSLTNGKILTIVYSEKSKNKVIIITGYYEN